jgi:hypothetical protein
MLTGNNGVHKREVVLPSTHECAFLDGSTVHDSEEFIAGRLFCARVSSECRQTRVRNPASEVIGVPS